MLVSCVAVAQDSHLAPIRSNAKPMNLPHVKRIEDAARSMAANSEESYQQLAAAVIQHPHKYHLPSTMESFAVSRLASAEREYQLSRLSAVHEGDITQVVNLLADRMSAPEFARTSNTQVRVVRMRLLMLEPTFMGREIIKAHLKRGDSIPDALSPSQSVHILLSLIDRKFYDPEFQLPPGGFEQIYTKQVTQRISSPSLALLSLAGTDQVPIHSKISVGNAEDGYQLELAVHQTVTNLGIAEGMAIMDTIASKLHIQ